MMKYTITETLTSGLIVEVCQCDDDRTCDQIMAAMRLKYPTRSYTVRYTKARKVYLQKFSEAYDKLK